MAAQTPAQEEFQAILDKASRGDVLRDRHPEDAAAGVEHDELDEEERFQQREMEEMMRAPSGGGSSRLDLPPPSFDSGRTTGVKGVIADARSFEQARRGGGSQKVGNKSWWKEGRANGTKVTEDDSLEEDEEFLEKWREERRKELARDGNDIRNRRTSPSVRRFGRFDIVDALGYLDAIEKVGMETVVVVFVYDVEVCFSLPPSLSFSRSETYTNTCCSAQSPRLSKAPLLLSSQYILKSTS